MENPPNAMIQSVASSDVTIANRVGRDSIAINCYAAIEVQTMTALEFLKRAADGKHRIVSSGDLHVMQISEAQANKLFFVDDQTGLGWALVPWELTTAKDRHRESGFFTKGGSGWNAHLHNEACDSESAERKKPVFIPTVPQTHSACLSYRHDYGILDDQARESLRETALDWWEAWNKEGVFKSA